MKAMQVWYRLGFAILCAGAMASAQAGSLVENIPALKRSAAALLAGTYPASDCSPQPNLNGDPPKPDRIVIGGDGSLNIGPVHLSMFDPAGEFAMTKTYVAGGYRAPANLFDYQLFVNGQMFDLNFDDQKISAAFLEAGYSGQTRNVTDNGIICPTTDARAMHAAKASPALHDFIAAVLTTDGQVVKGQCRPALLPKGKKRSEVQHPGSFSATLAGLTINGRFIPFDDAHNPVTEEGVGSRFSDGTLNASVTWKDGSSFHFERFMEAGVRFATFSYIAPSKSASESDFCQAD